MDTTPPSLLARLRQPGEQAAWERFVELYTPLLYHWSRRAGLADADAQDLVQDVLITVVRTMPEFVYDPARSFRGWLRTVTHNKFLDHQKKHARRPITGDAGLLDDVAAPAAEAFWEAEYRRHLVDRALAVMQAEFAPTTWQACWRFVVEGRPAAEVAVELGISENAVYIAKSRVLRRLRQELDGLLD